VEELDKRARQPLRISWAMPVSQAAPAARNSAEIGADASSGSGVSMEPEVAAQDTLYSVALAKTQNGRA
jgi:hypothetical protein